MIFWLLLVPAACLPSFFFVSFLRNGARNEILYCAWTSWKHGSLLFGVYAGVIFKFRETLPNTMRVVNCLACSRTGALALGGPANMPVCMGNDCSSSGLLADQPNPQRYKKWIEADCKVSTGGRFWPRLVVSKPVLFCKVFLPVHRKIYLS